MSCQPDEVNVAGLYDSHAWIVLSRQFAAQLTGLGDGVPRVPLTLTRLQTICQTDGATALTLVAHKLLVANCLWEME